MKRLSDKLLSIQSEWYARLAKEGFKDIEDSKGNLKQYDRRSVAFTDRDEIRDFFIGIDHYLTDHPELPEQDRKILELYSSGMYRCDIVKQLKLKDWDVLKVIRKYKGLL